MNETTQPISEKSLKQISLIWNERINKPGVKGFVKENVHTAHGLLENKRH